MGKDLGKIAGSLKAEAATFSDAMNESLAEAEKVCRCSCRRSCFSLFLCLSLFLWLSLFLCLLFFLFVAVRVVCS